MSECFCLLLCSPSTRRWHYALHSVCLFVTSVVIMMHKGMEIWRTIQCNTNKFLMCPTCQFASESGALRWHQKQLRAERFNAYRSSMTHVTFSLLSRSTGQRSRSQDLKKLFTKCAVTGKRIVIQSLKLTQLFPPRTATCCKLALLKCQMSRARGQRSRSQELTNRSGE